MDIKQFSIAGVGWISLTPKSVSFSGKMLPSDTHLTISYGNESKIADIHLSRQLPGGKKLYATICQVQHIDIDKISNFAVSRLQEFFLRHLTLVDPGQLSRAGYIFIACYDNIAERDTALAAPMKMLAQDTIVSKGKGRYRLLQDDKTILKIKDLLGSVVLSDKIYRWLFKNAYDPSVLQTEMKGAKGMLIGKGELSMVINIPFEDGSTNTYKLESSSVERMLEDFLISIKQSELGSNLLAQYHICLDCLQHASSQADINPPAPILIGYFDESPPSK